MTNQKVAVAQAVVLMGPMCSGKSTSGKLIAQELGWDFVDADDLHTPQNKALMHKGISMDDLTRMPWLSSVCIAMENRLSQGRSVVIACSALKEQYRQMFLAATTSKVAFVYLKIRRQEMIRRAARPDHFMSPELVDSQLAALEEPERALIIDADESVDMVVATAVKGIHLLDLFS